MSVRVSSILYYLFLLLFYIFLVINIFRITIKRILKSINQRFWEHLADYYSC